MDDQLELHLQRFLEEEGESLNEEDDDDDSDLKQLLTLQSSSYAAASTNSPDTQPFGALKQFGESSSLEEPQQSPQHASDFPKQELDPHIMESDMPENKSDSEGRAGLPPITVATDRFLRISNFVESQFEAPNSYTEVIIKLLWTLPIIAVLGNHVGWIWSLHTILGIMILNIKQGHHSMAGKAEQLPKSANDPMGAVGPVKQDVQRQKEQKKFKEETITKVSHLLGLAGAPPPQWPLRLDQSGKSVGDHALLDETSDNIDVETNNENESNDQHDKNVGTDLSAILPLLVNFVESHVQFLLTVDQALEYLRTSASIHLGLGPQSQCVERVEQAAMARKIRQNRRKQQTNTENNNNTSSEDDDCKHINKKEFTLEPQRGTNKSVLSLVSLRKNLAKSMVHHSATLDAFWKCLDEHEEPKSEVGEDVEREPLLEMPHIVNLAWIKDARRILAESLSGTVEELILLLEESSSSPEGSQAPEASRVWLWLEDADAQSRQLTQYLRGTLLLPYDTGTAEPSTTARPVDNPNDPLFRSLMNFRTQLDSLGTALWSCQQYCNLSSDRDRKTGTSGQGDQQSTISLDNMPNEGMNLEEDPVFLQRQWWMKIRQMSETCRAFETEISEMYFPQEAPSENETQRDDANDNSQEPTRSQETGDYVHGDSTSKTQGVEGATRKEKVTKTVVFSGKGKVEDRSRTSGRKGKGRNGTDSEGMDYGSALPQRDTVSELAMVSELQNRIKALHLDEEIEEDDESDSEEQQAARLARQPTAPLFLGASGSLLTELKQSIPSIGMLNSEIGNNAGEEIIGED